MNIIQNYNITNSQTSFGCSRKAVSTMAGKLKQNKLNQQKQVNNIIGNISQQYKCTPTVIKEALGINNKTTSIKKINTKISKFEKHMEYLKQGIKQGLEKDNIIVDNINIIITKGK